MSKISLPKEVLVVTIGLFLIIGILLITIIRPKGTSELEITSLKENTEITNFFSQLKYIQAVDLKTELSNPGLFLVDLRDVEYYSLSHIPNSFSATPDTIMPAFSERNPRAQKIVLIDDAGQTDKLENAIRILQENNIQNIYILSGGYPAWNTQIYPTISWADPNSAADHAKIRGISPSNVKTILTNKNVVFLDVRQTEDYEKNHKEGSLHIPFEKLESSVNSIPNMKMIIVYGSTPIDSFRAGVRLYDLGYPLVYTLVGGYIDIQNNL